MAIHVLPVNDLKEHLEKSTCDCCPSLIVEGGEMIFVHNAFDGREYSEDIKEKIKFNWFMINRNYPKSFSKMCTWINQNRFKRLNPTHLQMQPCEFHKGTTDVSRFVSIPVDKTWIDKFFSDALGHTIKDANNNFELYFNQYENILIKEKEEKKNLK